eukprot:TRINITY_DN28564_c0_g2_i1.p1 TRINITY_DN28564_c0_g2~~TRINITY_DN28564_c0_g2_i1.p1  ORF type:complete len:111 (-),score=13.49 TRINITY_DN28564_c0_g2_i1:67-399(-)
MKEERRKAFEKSRGHHGQRQRVQAHKEHMAMRKGWRPERLEVAPGYEASLYGTATRTPAISHLKHQSREEARSSKHSDWQKVHGGRHKIGEKDHAMGGDFGRQLLRSALG